MRSIELMRADAQWVMDNYAHGYIAHKSARDVLDLLPYRERVDILEKELAEAAEVMMRLHQIGQVKHIGLREVAEALRQVEPQFHVAAKLAEALRHCYHGESDWEARAVAAIVAYDAIGGTE